MCPKCVPITRSGAATVKPATDMKSLAATDHVAPVKRVKPTRGPPAMQAPTSSKGTVIANNQYTSRGLARATAIREPGYQVEAQDRLAWDDLSDPESETSDGLLSVCSCGWSHQASASQTSHSGPPSHLEAASVEPRKAATSTPDVSVVIHRDPQHMRSDDSSQRLLQPSVPAILDVAAYQHTSNKQPGNPPTALVIGRESGNLDNQLRMRASSIEGSTVMFTQVQTLGSAEMQEEAQKLGMCLLQLRSVRGQILEAAARRGNTESTLEAVRHQRAQCWQAHQLLQREIVQLNAKLEQEVGSLRAIDSTISELESELQNCSSRENHLQQAEQGCLQVLQLDANGVRNSKVDKATPTDPNNSIPGAFDKCGMLDDIAAVKGMDEDLISRMRTADITCLQQIPQSVDSQWCQYTTRAPVVISSDGCFSTSEPDCDTLWLSTFKSRGRICFVNGEESQDRDIAALAYRQLAKPNLAAPVSIMGLEPKLSVEHQFKVPASLSSYVTPCDQGNVIYNLTPKHTFVDLHIDYGADGISKTIDACEKFWFMYPPSPKNLELMTAAHGKSARLSLLIDNLEAGVLLKTTSAQAVYIPSGTIHATFTSQGGFLVAKDLITLGSGTPISSLLLSKYFTCFDQPSQELCLQWYLKTLINTATYQKFDDALQSWIKTEAMVRNYVARGSKSVRQAMIKFRDNLTSVVGDHDLSCPCGGMANSETLHQHLQRVHYMR
ncbi:hypothetical protein K461DRAFT_273498 [Myriangium duriaei CBS 260.36]|uniref:JmjC domain-containing protein n=1 Tax=Myriangium duriaei CBS 260.36 TaxID=1168546 RepID=A0A9P4J9J3_9PEZI|nr:hypothetical protein K461DRAFT_273498 [Myriangium duriaei CBS 260.36]